MQRVVVLVYAVYLVQNVVVATQFDFHGIVQDGKGVSAITPEDQIDSESQLALSVEFGQFVNENRIYRQLDC